VSREGAKQKGHGIEDSVRAQGSALAGPGKGAAQAHLEPSEDEQAEKTTKSWGAREKKSDFLDLYGEKNDEPSPRHKKWSTAV